MRPRFATSIAGIFTAACCTALLAGCSAADPEPRGGGQTLLGASAGAVAAETAQTPAAAVDNRWSCLGHQQWTPPSIPGIKSIFREPVPPVVIAVYKFVRFPNWAPFPGLSVKVCAHDDYKCSRPLDERVTVADGRVMFGVPTTVEHGFDGYLLVDGDGLVPTRVYYQPPIHELTELGPMMVLTKNDLAYLASHIGGAVLSPRVGVVAATAFDCQGAMTSHVTLDVSDKRGALFFDAAKNRVSEIRTETPMWFGIAPGTHVVTATIDAWGDVIGSAHVQVDGGGMTYVAMPPTP